MQDYIQHGTVTTFDHCLSVMYRCYEWAGKCRRPVRVRALLRAAMLHDFYLYDWHEPGDGSHHLHGFRHAKRAAETARAHFAIPDLEFRMIYCHMWPLNPLRVPTTREGWMLTLSDKWVSLIETLTMRKQKNATETAETEQIPAGKV